MPRECSFRSCDVKRKRAARVARKSCWRKVQDWPCVTLLTLTLDRRIEESTGDRFDRLRGGWRKLQKKLRFPGGLTAVEIPPGNPLHVHMHVLLNGAWYFDLPKLKALAAASGLGTYVNVSTADRKGRRWGARFAAYYVTKYVTKGSASGVVDELARRRLWSSFGRSWGRGRRVPQGYANLLATIQEDRAWGASLGAP